MDLAVEATAVVAEAVTVVVLEEDMGPEVVVTEVSNDLF